MTEERSNSCLKFQAFYSTTLLILLTGLILASIFTEQTNLSADVHPAVAFVVLIAGVVWLTMVEGGQGAIVGLTPVQHDLYKESHPTTYKVTTLAHKGDNLDRYLLGRQFMVILIVFSINMAAEPQADAEFENLPSWMVNVFLASGIAMILFTNMVGQLNSEINSCHCMLDYRKFLSWELELSLLWYWTAKRSANNDFLPQNCSQQRFCRFHTLGCHGHRIFRSLTLGLLGTACCRPPCGTTNHI